MVDFRAGRRSWLHASLCAALAAAPLAQASAQAPAAAVPAVPQPLIPDCADETTAEEIVVCGPSSRSPYRLMPPPEGFDPRGGIDGVSRERHRLIDVGAAGIHSCSTVGPGGWTGCDLRRWREAHEQRAGISQEQPHAARFGPVSIGVIKH
ncbi:MAG TPA: hypothetical protein VGB08_01550 [Allosphingosinicella sp.]